MDNDSLFIEGRPINHPFTEVADQAKELIESGATVYFKFTCAGCGKRCTFEEPNTLFKQGRCEDCNHVTDLETDGCGFMLVWDRRV